MLAEKHRDGGLAQLAPGDAERELGEHLSGRLDLPREWSPGVLRAGVRAGHLFSRASRRPPASPPAPPGGALLPAVAPAFTARASAAATPSLGPAATRRYAAVPGVTSSSSKPPAHEVPTLAWQRFVLDEDPESGELEEPLAVEVAISGNELHVRRQRGDDDPVVEVRSYASEDAARRGAQTRITRLRKDGYLEDGVVSRPALPDTRSAARAKKASSSTQGRLTFESQLPRFVERWRSAGLDPTLSFEEQCRVARLHPNQVASRCLAIACQTFGVALTERTRSLDPEHGTVGRIPGRLLAQHYQSPAVVLAMFREKLLGRLSATDDLDAPGLADEIAARLRHL